MALGLWTAPAAGADVPVGSGQPVPGTQTVEAVACTAAATCEGIGVVPNANPDLDQSALFAITNGVSGPRQVQAQGMTLVALTCATATWCLAVGSMVVSDIPEGLVVPITNGAAGTPVALADAQILQSISCPTASRCYAVGLDQAFNAIVVPVVGGAPSTPVAVPGVTTLDSIACSSAAVCEAVGFVVGPEPKRGILVSINDGVPGTVQTDANVTFLSSVACPSTGNCVAVGVVPAGQFGQEGAVVPIVNGVAGTPQVAAGTGVLNSIACATSTVCYAAGDLVSQGVSQGAVVAVNGGRPGPAQALPDFVTLPGLGCSTTICEASGEAPWSGEVVSIGGGTITCAVTGLVAGPPKQQQVTVQSSAGLASISNIHVTNGTVSVAPFTTGTSGPVAVTATKTDQSQITTWGFTANDVNGASHLCG